MAEREEYCTLGLKLPAGGLQLSLRGAPGLKQKDLAVHTMSLERVCLVSVAAGLGQEIRIQLVGDWRKAVLVGDSNRVMNHHSTISGMGPG